MTATDPDNHRQGGVGQGLGPGAANPEAAVEAIIAEVYGPSSATGRSVGWGNNQIWEIRHADGLDYLKRYVAGSEGYRRETWLLGALRGRVPVPEVRLAREDDGTGQPFLITRGVRGALLSKVQTGREALVGRMGTALAGLHSLRDPAVAASPLLQPRPGPALHEALRGLDDAEVACAVDQDRLCEAMAALRTPRRPVLTHGDFGDFQCLVADGAIVAIVDWEAANRSEPETDLAFAGAFLRIFRDPGEESAFLDGYRRAARMHPDLSLYENLLQGFLLALYALWRGRGQSFEADRARMALVASAGRIPSRGIQCV